MEHFDNGKALCKKCSEYKYINNNMEKTIEKNYGSKQWKSMSKTRNRNKY